MKNLINAILDRREDVESVNIYFDKEGNTHVSILPAGPEIKATIYHTSDGLSWERAETEKKPEKKTKTYLEDLKEKYPNYKKRIANGYPIMCPNAIGFKNVSICGDGDEGCEKCWNQFMEG